MAEDKKEYNPSITSPTIIIDEVPLDATSEDYQASAQEGAFNRTISSISSTSCEGGASPSILRSDSVFSATSEHGDMVDGGKSPLIRTDSVISTMDIPLHNAVCNFSPKEVSTILDTLPHNMDERNSKGRSAIHEGMRTYIALHPYDRIPFKHNFIEIIKILVLKGLDVNAKTQDRRRQALLHMVASIVDSKDMIVMLLASGGKVNVQDSYGQTPLHLATAPGYTSNIQALLEGGADPNIQDAKGHTSLHTAAKGLKHLEAMRLLIQSGGDIQMTDQMCRTPLHLASRSGRQDLVRELLQCGALINATDNSGQTPTHMAAKADVTGQVMKVLLTKKLDINAVDIIRQETALHKAVQANMLENIKLLCKARANPNVKDIFGDTVLHRACGKTEFIIWTSLMRIGGDALAHNASGETPFHKAQKAKNHMAIGVMRQYYDILNG